MSVCPWYLARQPVAVGAADLRHRRCAGAQNGAGHPGCDRLRTASRLLLSTIPLMGSSLAFFVSHPYFGSRGRHPLAYTYDRYYRAYGSTSRVSGRVASALPSIRSQLCSTPLWSCPAPMCTSVSMRYSASSPASAT